MSVEADRRISFGKGLGQIYIVIHQIVAACGALDGKVTACGRKRHAVMLVYRIIILRIQGDVAVDGNRRSGVFSFAVKLPVGEHPLIITLKDTLGK